MKHPDYVNKSKYFSRTKVVSLKNIWKFSFFFFFTPDWLALRIKLGVQKCGTQIPSYKRRETRIVY